MKAAQDAMRGYILMPPCKSRGMTGWVLHSPLLLQLGRKIIPRFRRRSTLVRRRVDGGAIALGKEEERGDACWGGATMRGTLVVV